jgi:tetratricopeptide (TPR) repeat protein
MKKPWTTLLFLFLCLFFLTAAAQPEAAQIKPDQFRTLLRQGIQKAFNLETSEAMAFFQKAVELDRENPTGYAFLALGHLFSYETSFDLKEREKDQEVMLEDVDEAQARGEKRVRMNPRDGQAYFALTLAKIVKVRWALNQKKYLVVAQEAANVWDYVGKAKELDPQNYDVYFPIGLLHYHIDHLPGATRFFSSLFVTAGDRQKGLQELALAAQKGDLLKELALAELSSVYTYFEDQPALAMTITMALKEKFPQNYNFSFALANTLSELQRFEEAFAIAREIEKGLQAGRPPFAPQLQPRYDHVLGRILFNQGDYPRAADSFQKALKDTSIYNARIRVSALVRLGMIHDIRRERKQAEGYYSRALDIEGGEGIAQVEAKKYLKTPYAPRPKTTGPTKAGQP